MRGGAGAATTASAAARLREQHLRAEVHEIERADDTDRGDRAAVAREQRREAKRHRAEDEHVAEQDSGGSGRRAAHAVTRRLRHREHHRGAGGERDQRPGREVEQEGVECHGQYINGARCESRESVCGIFAAHCIGGRWSARFMLVLKYWAEARVQHRAGRKQVTVRRYGWSDASQQRSASERRRARKEALARILAGEKLHRRDHKIPYNGAEGLPIREEILSTHGDAGNHAQLLRRTLPQHAQRVVRRHRFPGAEVLALAHRHGDSRRRARNGLLSMALGQRHLL